MTDNEMTQEDEGINLPEGFETEEETDDGLYIQPEEDSQEDDSEDNAESQEDDSQEQSDESATDESGEDGEQEDVDSGEDSIDVPAEIEKLLEEESASKAEETKETPAAQQAEPASFDLSKDPTFGGRLKQDYIPGTKEFFKACQAEAEEAVKEYLEKGEDYNEFDSNHKVAYQYCLHNAMDNRKKVYLDSVEYLKERDKQMQAAVEFKAKEDAFKKQFELIINNDRLDKLFQAAVGELKAKDYIKLNKAIEEQNYKPVIDFAKKIANIGNKVRTKKESAPSNNFIRKNQKNRSGGQHLFSDDLI